MVCDFWIIPDLVVGSWFKFPKIFFVSRVTIQGEDLCQAIVVMHILAEGCGVIVI